MTVAAARTCARHGCEVDLAGEDVCPVIYVNAKYCSTECLDASIIRRKQTFLLDPTGEQDRYFRHMAGGARHVYNFTVLKLACLDHDQYKVDRKEGKKPKDCKGSRISKFKFGTDYWTPHKRATPWLNDLPGHMLRAAVFHCFAARSNAYRRLEGCGRLRTARNSGCDPTLPVGTRRPNA